MRKVMMTTAAALFATMTIVGFNALASGDLPLNDEVKAKITAHLTDMGYEVSKIKIEDGLYEAYAKKDGVKMEIFMNEELEFENIKAKQKLELNNEIKAQIKEKLTAEGHEVGKIKIEDGLYEAYTRQDGHKYEVFLDMGLNIVRIEND